LPKPAFVVAPVLRINAHGRSKVRLGLASEQVRPGTVDGTAHAIILNRRPQPGRYPLHRIGLGDELVDVMAIDALKRAHLESDPGRLDARQDHRIKAVRTDMALNCNAAGVEQDCEG